MLSFRESFPSFLQNCMELPSTATGRAPVVVVAAAAAAVVAAVAAVSTEAISI